MPRTGEKEIGKQAWPPAMEPRVDGNCILTLSQPIAQGPQLFQYANCPQLVRMLTIVPRMGRGGFDFEPA